jgi:hypothetical protein
MVPSQFRLETVSLHLIERLEGPRRAFAGREDDAASTFDRLAQETAAGAAAECREYMGDDPFPGQLVEEIRRSFVPRYTRIAVEQTALEVSGYGSWRKGDLLARAVTGVLALVVALLLQRILPALLEDVVWLGVPVVVFLPELRGVVHRLHYRRELQSLVDDMARIQQQLDAYIPADRAPEAISMLGPKE